MEASTFGFLKKITTLLSDQNCEDTKLFADASENLYQLEPSSQAAYNLARLFYKKADIEKSIVYYREAIDNATVDEDEDKAKYNYELGLIQFSKYDNKQLARTYALSAIESMPEWGEPYILIGNLYASSSSVCGENDFEKTTIFWAAVDKFQKAKALDPEVNGEAAELISKYSPSVLNHTGVTCGDPSPIVVARNKNAWVLSANKSWKSSGMFFMVSPFG